MPAAGGAGRMEYKGNRGGATKRSGYWKDHVYIYVYIWILKSPVIKIGVVLVILTLWQTF